MPLLRLLWTLGLALAMALAAPAYAQLKPVPKLAGHVTDEAGLLDAAQRQKLEAALAEYEAQTGSQIAVLVVKSTEPEAIEQYSIRVADAWKLGRKGVDDGVLVLVATENPRALRRLRIEAGRGVQGVLTDAKSKRILQDVIAPHFRENHYYEGLVAGVSAIATLLSQEKFPEPARKNAAEDDTGLLVGGGIGLLLMLGGVLLIASMFGGRKRSRLTSGRWDSDATGFVIGSILGHMSSGRHRGGGGFGGFSGGGFGGFSGGGGSFDGGGASGDW